MQALANGTVSGFAGVGSVFAALDGQLVLNLTHEGGVWGGLASFQGSGSMQDGLSSSSWSGVASTGGSQGGAWDGDSLVFNLAINHNGISQEGVLTLQLHLDLRFGLDGSILIDDSSLILNSSPYFVTAGFAPLIEVIDGSGGNDTLVGTDGDDFIDGRGGDDSISAAGGDDTVQGGDGLDTISGGAGSDEIDGGAGADSINGGTGKDTLYGNGGNDTVLGGDGADELVGGSGKGDDRYSGGKGVDTLRYSSAINAVDADLGAGRGSGLDIGKDTIVGVENLIGGAGADKLTGDAGDNAITGGAGNDTIKGGAGNDRLYGGAGNDRYQFVEAPGDANADVIVGFASGKDKLQLDDLVFGPLRDSGAISGAEFDNYFDYVDGKLYYDPDGSLGAEEHVLLATLQGAPALVASDLLMF